MKSAYTLLAAALLTVSTSAFAINEGFETGDTTGYNLTVPAGASAQVVTSFDTYSPAHDKYFLLLKTDGPGSYTTARQQYKLKAGDRLRGNAALASRDTGGTYNDNAQVRIRYGTLTIATPFSASAATVGANTNGPWTPWSFTAPADGTYTVEFRIANQGDASFDSRALFDAAELDIDIKPGDASNEINPNSTSGFAVATLSSPSFNATTIDQSTIRFGVNGKNTQGPDVATDADSDGDTDIVTVVKTSETGITCATSYGFITAKLYSGQIVTGSDKIKPVGSSCP
ncbi:MAG: hypothetical protein V4729_12275 [Pseudomonadota bacterium]